MKPEKIPVYLFSYRKSYYLTHPWKIFSELVTGIKNLWHRARYGYAYVDAWNMNTAWCYMGANMLLHIAEHGSAYPGLGAFDTPEKWRNHLVEMAQRLRDCADIDWDERNEFWDQCLKNPHDKEIEKKWVERQAELDAERKALIAETFEILGKNFDMYWD